MSDHYANKKQRTLKMLKVMYEYYEGSLDPICKAADEIKEFKGGGFGEWERVEKKARDVLGDYSDGLKDYYWDIEV